MRRLDSVILVVLIVLPAAVRSDLKSAEAQLPWEGPNVFDPPTGEQS
jgi:hypothetical protein